MNFLVNTHSSFKPQPNCRLLYENVLNASRKALGPILPSVVPLLYHLHHTLDGEDDHFVCLVTLLSDKHYSWHIVQVAL